MAISQGVSIAVTSQSITMAVADLPRGGVWKMCYCTDYDGCDQDTDFTVHVKTVTVYGADGTDGYDCVRFAPACTFTVTPSPATHAILTVLKAGESVFQTLY